MQLATNIILAILVLLVVIKTVLFFKNIHHKTFARWFFFNEYSIANSHNKQSEFAKRSQNTLSAFILVVGFIAMVLWFIAY